MALQGPQCSGSSCPTSLPLCQLPPQLPLWACPSLPRAPSLWFLRLAQVACPPGPHREGGQCSLLAHSVKETPRSLSRGPEDRSARDSRGAQMRPRNHTQSQPKNSTPKNSAKHPSSPACSCEAGCSPRSIEAGHVLNSHQPLGCRTRSQPSPENATLPSGQGPWQGALPSWESWQGGWKSQAPPHRSPCGPRGLAVPSLHDSSLLPFPLSLPKAGAPTG